MAGSFPRDLHDHQSLSIQMYIQPSENMSRRPGQGPGPNGHHSGRVSSNNSFVNRSGHHGYPFAALVPTQASAASRRHSMTVQHMLNPSDEEPRRPSQSRSSQSSDNDSDRRVPSPGHGSISARHGPRSHGGHPSRGPVRGQARVNRHANRRAARRRSPSSSGSENHEAPRRAFRKTYTDEQAHFIW